MTPAPVAYSVGLTFKPALQDLFIPSGYSGKITAAVAGALKARALDTQLDRLNEVRNHRQLNHQA